MLKLSPRWKKILSDLRLNKTRTLLVVLSIVVGIFAIGSIAGTYAIIERETKATYMSIDPASGVLASTVFDDALLAEIETLPEVEMVEARRSFNVKVDVDGELKDLKLFVLRDYEDIRLNKILSDSGEFPPTDNAMLIEIGALSVLGTEEGDTLSIQTPSGGSAELPITGIVKDYSLPSAAIVDSGYGYITVETLESLGENAGYNELHFLTAEKQMDEEHIQSVANIIRDQMEQSGLVVFAVVVPTPGEPIGYVFTVALLLVLGVIGSLTFLLSGFLIVNIVSALLAQQTRQIGVMKAVGAKTSQIMGMYLGLVLFFGVLALLIGMPLSLVGAAGLATAITGLNNYEINNYAAPWWVFALQIAIGLLVPLAAGFIPVWLGTRKSVRAALDSQGIVASNSIFDRALTRARGLPRPVLLSFRNTFRQKARLALTLITLALAGAIFATVFTVRDSLFATLDDFLAYSQHDIQLGLDDAYPVEALTAEAMQVEGVERVEPWANSTGRYIRENGGESGDINLIGLPADSTMIDPILKEGRWLQAGDTNAIVLNANTAEEESEIKVGDEITLIVRGQESTWQVVGIARAIFNLENEAYTTYEALSESIGETGLTRSVKIATSQSDSNSQNTAATLIAERYTEAGYFITTTETTASLEDDLNLRFNTLIFSLLALAVLLAVVGGLGIAGTTSINVLERMREIGVMRSVGASDFQVQGIFIIESLFVGFVGWVIGSLLALPISRLLSDGVGVAFSNAPLTYSFSIFGAILWLVVALVIAFLSSYLPARRASQITLREVLAYE